MKKNTQIKYNIYEKLLLVGKNAGCHQRADRSFFYHGYKFPVCARCTGVLLGYIIGILLSCISHIRYKVCLLCCVVMFFDWTLQQFRIKESTNLRRLVTGIFGGAGLVCLQILLIRELIRIIF